MIKNLSYDQWSGVVRHVLTIVGTILVSKGVFDDSNWTIISGSVLSIFALIWSIRTKSK